MGLAASPRRFLMLNLMAATMRHGGGTRNTPLGVFGRPGPAGEERGEIPKVAGLKSAG